MWYTQIDFVPPNLHNKSVIDQARWLLYEIIKGKGHPWPCNCGACIYVAYGRSLKRKGRRFSKRTFFVYFIRYYYFITTYYDRDFAEDYVELKKEAKYRRFKAKEKLGLKREPRILIDQVFKDVAAEATKRRTCLMLKDLWNSERRPAAKKFLRGILVKKCFYTYYSRAQNPELGKIIYYYSRAQRDP